MSEDALKRGSDSLLEAKLKDQLSKPRSLTNRAQSLDLTYSLAKISELGSGMAPPESPTTSTAGADTGGNSSPVSVTAPSFPSVYGTPVTGGPQAGSLTSNPPGGGVGVGGTGAPAGSVPSGAAGPAGGRLPVVGATPGPSGSSGPTHQRSGRTPDNEDVTKMFSNLVL